MAICSGPLSLSGVGGRGLVRLKPPSPFSSPSWGKKRCRVARVRAEYRGGGGGGGGDESLAGLVVGGGVFGCDFHSADWLIHDDHDMDEDDDDEDEDDDPSVDAILLLQKSMLEKQWALTFDGHTKSHVTTSGSSARRRRMAARAACKAVPSPPRPDLFLQTRTNGHVNNQLLSHAQVLRLSHKIKLGLSLQRHKSKLEQRLGCEPSDKQLAASLRISSAELHSRLIESCLAREKLAMSNIRLVMSIAQKYENMGAEMADLVQAGLVGLLRGIERFEPSKGFRISTYVYWWIRQGVSRALVENSRTLRLPTYMHERLSSIRNAKTRLERRGVAPSVERIAECLKISKKKVFNATEASNKVLSFDREAFPSLNGLPGETHHSYVADKCPDNIPWHGVEEWLLKDQVKKLIDENLGERERDIIRLYYGLDNECLTWEDISKRIGLSRERVRQVGLVALEKLKHAARAKRMQAMVIKY